MKETIAQAIVQILRARGFRDSEIGRDVGCTRESICRIASGKKNGRNSEETLLEVVMMLPLTDDESTRIQRARLHLDRDEPIPVQQVQQSDPEQDKQQLAQAIMLRGVPLKRTDDKSKIIADTAICTFCMFPLQGNSYPGTYQQHVYVLCSACAQKHGYAR